MYIYISWCILTLDFQVWDLDLVCSWILSRPWSSPAADASSWGQARVNLSEALLYSSGNWSTTTNKYIICYHSLPSHAFGFVQKWSFSFLFRALLLGSQVRWVKWMWPTTCMRGSDRRGQQFQRALPDQTKIAAFSNMSECRVNWVCRQALLWWN